MMTYRVSILVIQILFCWNTLSASSGEQREIQTSSDVAPCFTYHNQIQYREAETNTLAHDTLAKQYEYGQEQESDQEVNETNLVHLERWSPDKYFIYNERFNTDFRRRVPRDLIDPRQYSPETYAKRVACRKKGLERGDYGPDGETYAYIEKEDRAFYESIKEISRNDGLGGIVSIPSREEVYYNSKWSVEQFWERYLHKETIPVLEFDADGAWHLYMS